jgi:hypothetical protein
VPSEEKKSNPDNSGPGDGKVQKLMEKHEKKWKQKFIKIW